MKGEIRKRRERSNATNILRVAIVLLFLGLAIWAITLNRHGLVIAHHEPWLWLTVALVSVGPELAGIVIGVVTIDYLNERRQDDQLKKQLILQMGSSHNDVTDTAIRVLRARGWLQDGSLSRADFVGADLSGADLERANLSEAGLGRANLSRANLKEANLSGTALGEANLSGAFFELADLSKACLWDANLSGADFQWADLSQADLQSTDLSGADFQWANLNGANLFWADLSGAVLWGANLNGTRSWTIEQLEQAETLEGATMPNGVQLGQERTQYMTSPFREPIKGPTFEEWKAQYLAKQEAERGQNEADSKLDDSR